MSTSLSQEEQKTINTIALALSEIIDLNNLNIKHNLNIRKDKAKDSREHTTSSFQDNLYFAKKLTLENFITYNYLKLSLNINILKVSFIYLNIVNASGIAISNDNVYLLLYVALILAQKMWADFVYPNSEYASFANIPIKEFAEMEMEFVESLDYRLFVDVDLFEKYESYFSFFIFSFNDMKILKFFGM